MNARVHTSSIVFHQWDAEQGLIEKIVAFDSVDKLFARCLEIRAGETIDRVVLEGIDQDGRPRRLTLSFQSVTVSDLDGT